MDHQDNLKQTGLDVDPWEWQVGQEALLADEAAAAAEDDFLAWWFWDSVQ